MIIEIKPADNQPLDTAHCPSYFMLCLSEHGSPTNSPPIQKVHPEPTRLPMFHPSNSPFPHLCMYVLRIDSYNSSFHQDFSLKERWQCNSNWMNL